MPNSKLMIFDIETDGLYFDAKRLLCSAAYFNYCHPPGIISFPGPYCSEIEDGLRDDSVTVVGHNIIGFDIPMMARLKQTPVDIRPSRLFDTLICAQLAFPDIWALTDKDKLPKGLQAPVDRNLWTSHSLKAWGQRLGVLKDSFGEEEAAFNECTPELIEYNRQDIVVSKALYEFLMSVKDTYWSWEALLLEQEVAQIISRQCICGVHFNRQKAQDLYMSLSERTHELRGILRSTFPDRDILVREWIAKANNSRYGYVKGQSYQKWETKEFNPNSNDDIAYELSTRYGWVPSELTPKGKPKIDEETLHDAIHLKGVPEIIEFKLVNKLLSQLGNGDTSWLKKVDHQTDIMHGSVNSLGAGTRRMTHSNPNLAQIPNANHKYGKVCRALFSPPSQFDYMVGCDADQLELRGLAHLLFPFDGGAYVKAALTGSKKDKTDIHWTNAKAFDVDDRDLGKTMFYAMIYGSGDEKLGRIKNKGWDKTLNAATGKQLKANFYKGMPAFKRLLDAISNTYKQRGYLIDANGHPFRLRSMHSALNAINQRLGAIVMKVAQVILDRALRGLKLIPRVDYEFLLTIHDEFQTGARTLAIAEIIKREAPLAISRAGEMLKLHCPIGGTASIGKTWADTH